MKKEKRQQKWKELEQEIQVKLNSLSEIAGEEEIEGVEMSGADAETELFDQKRAISETRMVGIEGTKHQANGKGNVKGAKVNDPMDDTATTTEGGLSSKQGKLMVVKSKVKDIKTNIKDNKELKKNQLGGVKPKMTREKDRKRAG